MLIMLTSVEPQAQLYIEFNALISYTFRDQAINTLSRETRIVLELSFLQQYFEFISTTISSYNL